MLLTALQSNPAPSDGGDLDALTLVLVVAFLASMAALTVLLMRRARPGDPDPIPVVEANPVREREAAATPAWEEARQFSGGAQERPVWLRGVTFSQAAGSVSAASAVIEALLASRRDGDLAKGAALYTPRLREQLERELGVDASGLERTLAEARIPDEAPALRSVEVIGGGEEWMRVRAGYSDRSSEAYELVLVDGGWLIDRIETRAGF